MVNVGLARKHKKSNRMDIEIDVKHTALQNEGYKRTNNEADRQGERQRKEEGLLEHKYTFGWLNVSIVYSIVR